MPKKTVSIWSKLVGAEARKYAKAHKGKPLNMKFITTQAKKKYKPKKK